jgi:hypothetical protein
MAGAAGHRTMNPPPQSNPLLPLGSQFDQFLYAQVGDDRQGGTLSVISALARLDVDPWEQAGTLARLPVDAAISALSTLLARLPAGPGTPVDLTVVATHLVTLLPRGPGLLASANPLFVNVRNTVSRRMWVLLGAACLLLFLAARLLMSD